MFDLVGSLRRLAVARPVFHSEADFQHAFAWQIHEEHPHLSVRLEYRPQLLDRKAYIDIWVCSGDDICAIELKYKTRRLTTMVKGEPFYLLDQSAQDIARYDFCKDVSRIEVLAKAYPGMLGFAVFLTNDRGYWQKSKRGGTIDTAFRLHEGRELLGELRWDGHASDGTMKDRTDPIRLDGQYGLNWLDYSKCSTERHGLLRMLIVRMEPVHPPGNGH